MNILKRLIDKIRNLDKKVKKVMHYGFRISFTICIISIFILLTYELFYSLPNLFYVGLSLFRSSLMLACASFMCAIGFDTIKKEMA